MGRMRVLLVEDDGPFGGALERGLRSHGIDVTWVRGTGPAQRALAGTVFDVLVVDWMLPDGDGPWLIQHLRARGSTTPAMLLTARDAIEDRVHGLDAGADDYLVKPFHLDELLARLRALGRRTGQPPPVGTGMAGLLLEEDEQRASVHGERVDLTPGETAVLAALLRHAPAITLRAALARALMDADGAGTGSSIETHVSRLRTKLRGAPVRIRSVRSLGYRIEEER